MEETSATQPQSTPLLRDGSVSRPASPSRPTATTTLAILLNRAGGGGAASVAVRETAARQLEERRADWGYSKPVVALDITWNIVFVMVSIVMLSATADERPNAPIRLWVCGYALLCIVHAMLVWLEYRRRSLRRRTGFDDAGNRASDSDATDGDDNGDTGIRGFRFRYPSSIAKRCETVTTMVSFLWWIVGFYWVVSGGNTLFQNAPRLYWLSVVFLAFDVFFAIFCVALACMIGIALCCCFPCIIAILYAVAGQEGATEADLSILPRYRFEQNFGNGEKASAKIGTMIPIGTTSGSSERDLVPEDAECSICLTAYEDGAELLELPCNHHFHSACIRKWLQINATCPLCKYNIIKSNENV